MIDSIFVLHNEDVTHDKDHILRNGGWLFAARNLLSGTCRNGQNNILRRTGSLFEEREMRIH